MKQTLSLKTSQQLALTPQLKQSLRLLHLSSLDLEREIQQTLDSNPLLERDEELSAPGEINSPRDTSQSNAANNDTKSNLNEFANSPFESEPFKLSSKKGDREDDQQETASLRINSSNLNTHNGSGNSSDNTEYSQLASDAASLHDHLSWQIQMTALSDRDKLIGDAILYCLDDDGYLCLDLQAICGLVRLPQHSEPISEDEVHAVLSLIKTLDPVGVGATNLSERLTILLAQLPAATAGRDLALKIVANYIPLLAARNYKKLRKQLAVSEAQLLVSTNLITHLQPRITNAYQSVQQNYISPDLLVNKTSSGWRAQLNSENQAKISTNETYTKLLKSGTNKSADEYIQQNLQQAEQFIKGLMNRYDTLLLVGQAIVDRQQGFFNEGEGAMRPMILHDIALALGLNESTISRAVAGKYLLCPRGVFELKFFFCSALSNQHGIDSSSTAIRSAIRKLINTEIKSQPLSDSKIALQLANQGYRVARRTVAKYRESLNIAPSGQRKSS